MPHLRSLLVPAALAVAACAAPAAEQRPASAAAPQQATAARPKPDDGLVCHYERTIGSNIAEKVCVPKDAKYGDEAREWMRKEQSNVPQGKAGGG